VQYDRLVPALAGVLGTITVVLTVLGVAYNPAILFVAVVFGAATYLVYYHASGRLAARVYRTVERQAAVDGGRTQRRRGRGSGRGPRGGFGAGPREEWTPPRDGATAREAGFGRGTAQAGVGAGQRQRRTRQRQQGRRTGQRQRAARTGAGPTTAEAYRTLGLDPGADDASVKRAYREMVKEVHPDADGGDEAAFKAVTAAYERLTD
jgi:type II secretory pathway pseudopilin PulG